MAETPRGEVAAERGPDGETPDGETPDGETPHGESPPPEGCGGVVIVGETVRGGRRTGDRGAGSVLVVAVLAVGCLLAAAAAVVGQAATAAARASSAADLAALAAQDVRWGRVPSGLPPCGAAAEVARAQGAELVRCSTTEEAPGGVVEVEVSVTPAGAAARWGPARAVARAGEAPEPP